MTDTSNLFHDPLKMPPPYWRSSGVIFQVIEALSDLVNHLDNLLPTHSKVEEELDEYFFEKTNLDEDDEEFDNIANPLWEIEHKIQLKCELAVFMSSIALEDRLNMVIVYNLDGDIADVIEKLSPPDKLKLLSVSLTKRSVKSERPFEAIQALTSWRNAYAHGHCTDRPTKSIRHNHLIKPDYYPSLPREVEFVKKRIEDFLLVLKFLSSISINNYTKGRSTEVDEIEQLLTELKKFIFKYDGNGDVYEVVRLD